LEVRRIAGTRAKNACAILEGLGKLRRKLRRARQSAAPIVELQAWLDACLPPALSDHLKLWARGETANRTEEQRLASALPKLARLSRELHRLREHVGNLDPELLGSARRVVAPLLERVRGEMRARGALGFAELLRGAQRLLRDHESLLAQIRRRVDQLLVDEFQDTDHQQCDLIRRLALSGPKDQRPGLFVVGDPKQSIYGWRNAELRAYEEFVAAVEAEDGERLALVENFRSVPAILDEVERVTAPVMRRQPGLQPEYRSLVACESLREAPGWDRGAQAPVEHWISWRAAAEDARQPAEGNAQETSALEARALVTDLVAVHRAGVAWKDVGLLLRSLTDLDTYLAALREARVPFVVSRDRQYYRRREIIDAAALVRTVLAPEDHLALLTFLRSVAVGVPDVALIPLWARQLPRRFTELVGPEREPLDEIRRLAREVAVSLPSEIPGLGRVRGWEHNLVHAAECLAELRRSFEEEPADVFVERLRRLPLFEACEAARYLGAFRLANLERFFGQLLVGLEEEAGDRHRVLRRLRTRIAEGYEAEEARPPEAGEDAVQVMTIHKAKGLEFDCVYLLQMHKEAGRRSAPSVEIGEWDGRFEYQFFGAPTPGFDRLTARRDDVSRAELVRTLYVAMTRAAQRLVLVGRRPLDGVAEALDRAGTHMELLLHRRGPQPSPAELIELWQSGEARRRQDGVLWFLPGLEELEAAPVEAGAEPVLPSPAEVAAVRDQLRVDRQAAAERMGRPFRCAASKLNAPLAADDLVEIRADRRLTELIASPPESDPGRRGALVAGSAIHRVMETFDLTADPEVELERQRRLLPEYLRMFASAEEAEAAFSRARHLFDR
ncbi:MAG: UvrD-helicase domain-containing protein, partial [bacterium]|nr:UvrD-helicase domain-containing protein [bacterium]